MHSKTYRIDYVLIDASSFRWEAAKDHCPFPKN